MIYFITSIIVLTFIFIYNRYFPVRGIRCSNMPEQELGKIDVVDLRDYNESYKDPIPGAMNIPIAYLNRYYMEIRHKNIHVIASDRVQINFGIRLLKQKGFQVTGCTIANKECAEMNSA
ncbi:hypothetical protein [Bacillus sp. V2I10]|uniref:hypothetical protein n=1 Tax=Bacillus sp. V2I10 TaxID=3042276 RepID=UPI0027817D48|nr:hypothetical protein [Bacillus sp. V2I10]MDQ0857364.1 rhodanese-related sulfurtransferase [Bacillus sp. V2I10]